MTSTFVTFYVNGARVLNGTLDELAAYGGFTFTDADLASLRSGVALHGDTWTLIPSTENPETDE